ncbi:MAG: cob(I)yrinic acid a,c-diamide adenosyltransferase [Thermoleophilia bacterium]|nr:cob(I)yrinic acid a,c-diamide adenosyltransferase [Thermoleophilia bacterium]
MRKGRVIINTGEGKGKTTAALGAALRAAGHGHRVAIVQFIKGNWNTGETRALEQLPTVEVTRIGSGFTWLAEDPEEPRRLARQAWEAAKEFGYSDRYELLILDELNCALNEGYVSVAEVLEFLRTKPERLSVIITGRGAPAELIAAADTVTEMRCVKHAYYEGEPARKGIEY